LKIIRRGIIVICLIYLIGYGKECIPESKCYYENLETLVKKGEAQVIEVDKSLNIDNAKIHINRLISTDEDSYIRYSYKRKEEGWSFGGGGFKLIDDKGKEYSGYGAASHGKPWGQDGITKIDRLDDDIKYLIIQIELYDRKDEIKISLEKEGENNENQ